MNWCLSHLKGPVVQDKSQWFTFRDKSQWFTFRDKSQWFTFRDKSQTDDHQVGRLSMGYAPSFYYLKSMEKGGTKFSHRQAGRLPMGYAPSIYYLKSMEKEGGGNSHHLPRGIKRILFDLTNLPWLSRHWKYERPCSMPQLSPTASRKERGFIYRAHVRVLKANFHS